MENWSSSCTNMNRCRQRRSHWSSLSVLGGVKEAVLSEDKVGHVEGEGWRYAVLFFSGNAAKKAKTLSSVVEKLVD